MNQEGKTVRIYNILLPIWLLVWVPSLLWLGLIPLNFLLDWLVTGLSFRRGGVEGSRQRALLHSWKVCLIGFFSDFAGAMLLLLPVLTDSEFGIQVMEGPFSGIPSFLYYALSIGLSALLIYWLNRRMLTKDSSLTQAQVRLAARNLAVFTAPYLFLIPITALY